MENRMERINIILPFSRKEMKYPTKNRIVYQERKWLKMLKKFLNKFNRKNYLRSVDLKLDIVSLIQVWIMTIIKIKTKSLLPSKEIELLNKCQHY